jgi:hypothetical protein
MKRGLAALAIVALAAGCAALNDESASSEDDVRPTERAMIGRAKPYPADKTLEDKKDALDASQKARREAAWTAIAKVLKPVNPAEREVKEKLPAFRTWYQKDDLERVFARLYEQHGAENRKAKKPFTKAAIDAALDWNATDRGAWTEQQYFDRVKSVESSKAAAQGIGGNSRVSYSTGFIRHLLSQYGPMTKCARGEIADAPDAEPKSDTNFSTCLDEEFPKDAALIKASWLRADFGLKVPVRPTDAAALADRLAEKKDDGGWGKGDPANEASPDESSIYTVKMSDGSTFRMPALHLVTKELREWLWITIWWSPDPDSDFGADRPEAIVKLGGPWKNYKMSVVTAYEEKDPDPRGGFEGSLGDALAATYQGVGKPTWTSNQYIERGAHNAQTNCIGCHQHAGTSLTSESVLSDPAKFPEHGREKIRKNFPTDYIFAAMSAPESLAQSFQAQLTHYDSVDR